MQFMMKLQSDFKAAHIGVYLRPYEVIVLSADSGIIGNFLFHFPKKFYPKKEYIPNTVTVDYLKKTYLNHNVSSLSLIYQDVFGIHFEEAQKNFVESLAGYSLITYLLNLKDRYLKNSLKMNKTIIK